MPSPTPCVSVKRYKWLTLSQKAAICRHAATATDKPLSLSELATWASECFNLEKPPSLATISRLLSRSANICKEANVLPHQKKLPSAAVEAFDAPIKHIFDDMEGNMDITGDMIKEIGRQVVKRDSDMTDKCVVFSNGWLQRFQRRHGISLKQKHGEAGSVDKAATEAGRAKMRKLTDSYARCDVYNMDETAYNYQDESSVTLTAMKTVAGRKRTKRRLTMALATNADGTDKLPPIFIGTAACPIPLRGRLANNRIGELDVLYYGSRKGWMTTVIFQRWLRDWDAQLREEKRHILLLVDNVSTHVRPTDPPLSNVRLEFLPKNQTSVLQPLDQGPIANTKNKIRGLKAINSVAEYFKHGPVQPKTDVFQAIKLGKEAWDNVTPNCIRNCWRHAGILSDRSKINTILNPADMLKMSSILCTD